VGFSADAQPFQVDLHGVVDLLSRHIYSSPNVYLRELLQNGVDAITARAALPGQPAADVQEPQVRISPLGVGPLPEEFVLVDDGIGLSVKEVTELLATVGRSSKRDFFDLPRTGYLGQFGIGLLSCFMVAETIRIVSASATGAPPVEWVGDASGTFSVRELPAGTVPIGSSVHLRSRFGMDELLGCVAVTRLARHFGEYLNVPIRVEQPDGTIEQVNRTPLFLSEGTGPQVLDFGAELIGAKPLAALDLNSPGTQSKGKAFVLPFAPPPQDRQSNWVYLGGMLLSEHADSLLPGWAFFVRAVVNSEGLSPTASREDLVDDYRLEHTRSDFGNQVRTWLAETSLSDPYLFDRFLQVHETTLKQVVLNDSELARFILPWLSVETSQGRMRVEQLVKNSPIRYTQTVSEFRQLVGVSRSDRIIVNGGYLWDADLVRILPEYFDVDVSRVDILAELDSLEPAPIADRDLVLRLEERGSAVLKNRSTTVVVRVMAQPDTPAIFVADPELFHRIDRQRVRDVANPLWTKLLGQVDDYLADFRGTQGDDALARLCLNWANPLVRSLAKLSDDAVFSRVIGLLYAQTQLAGQQPLSTADRRLLHTAISDLIALSIQTPGDPDDH
jgi:molecular chaperone HtpG